MPSFHAVTYQHGATLELFRDPQDGNWVIRIFGEDRDDELYSCRVYDELTLALDDPEPSEIKLT